MKKKKLRNNLAIVIGLFIILISLIIIIPVSFTRYESRGDSNLGASVAYYVLGNSYQYLDVKLPDMVPRAEPYVYNFTISNNKNGKRAEVFLEYDLLIKTTTNLELNYELYLNEDYQHPNAQSIFLTNQLTQDEHGTYFRDMTSPTQYFNYNYDETNSYTLLIYFDERHKHADYQNVFESIFLIIDSRQTIQ